MTRIGSSCFPGLRWAQKPLFGAAALMSIGCNPQPKVNTEATPDAVPPLDLLIGYDLLASTLSDESSLGALELFKTLTFKGPNDEIEKMMNTLSDASKRNADELAKLRRLSPNVAGELEKRSAIGDSITAVAKDIGKSEMTSRSGGFDIRFVLLQAQATRMVAAIATATADIEPNQERKDWLKRLADEYEGYRSEIVKYLWQ
jgi:hypothetical protein